MFLPPFLEWVVQTYQLFYRNGEPRCGCCSAPLTPNRQCQKCGAKNVSQCTGQIAEKAVIVPDNRGLAIPYVFARLINESDVIEGRKEFLALKTACHDKTWQEAREVDDFDDLWADCLDRIVIKLADGAVFSLHQDGDVWLVPHSDHIKFVVDDESLDNDDLHSRYDDMLDEAHGEAVIAGMKYSTSRVLRGIDPIAYRVGFSDWLDSEIGETIVEFDGKYYPIETKIPESSGEFFDDPEEFSGHYEWI